MHTRMPKAASVLLLRVSASTPGSSVVTSTSKGAKSSATRFQIVSMRAASSSLSDAGLPSVSYAGVVIAAPPVKFVFQEVLVVVWPSKSRKIFRW